MYNNTQYALLTTHNVFFILLLFNNDKKTKKKLVSLNAAFVIFHLQVIGPRLMENRKPFELRKVLIVYNFLQVIFSCWLFYEASSTGWLIGYSFRCQPVDYSRSPVAMRVSDYANDKASLSQFYFEISLSHTTVFLFSLLFKLSHYYCMFDIIIYKIDTRNSNGNWHQKKTIKCLLNTKPNPNQIVLRMQIYN